MMRALVLLFFAACSSAPAKEPNAAPADRAPSQNEQLYAKGEALEKDGHWEEAANTYQKYVLAKGDALSPIDRSSMELRIKKLRAKVWPEPEGPPKPVKGDVGFPEPPKDAACARPYNEAKYEDAIDCFRDDYLKTKDPRDILYAARANELNANLREAIQLNELFLRAADAGTEDAAVRARIQLLKERLAKR